MQVLQWRYTHKIDFALSGHFDVDWDYCNIDQMQAFKNTYPAHLNFHQFYVFDERGKIHL